MKGRFITLEGTEGVGKTTQNQFIQHYLQEKGIEFIVTREPGGTPLGEKIRALLLDTANGEMASDTELLLMFAARAQHLAEKIVPALACGKWVICDRFVDSSFAYQGFGRKLGTEKIQQLERWTLNGLQADKTFLLLMDVKEGLERARKRAALDRFEQEKVEFYQRVQQGYLERARQHPHRFAVIDAAQSIPQVQKAIQKELDKLIDE